MQRQSLSNQALRRQNHHKMFAQGLIQHVVCNNYQHSRKRWSEDGNYQTKNKEHAWDNDGRRQTNKNIKCFQKLWTKQYVTNTTNLQKHNHNGICKQTQNVNADQKTIDNAIFSEKGCRNKPCGDKDITKCQRRACSNIFVDEKQSNHKETIRRRQTFIKTC